MSSWEVGHGGGGVPLGGTYSYKPGGEISSVGSHLLGDQQQIPPPFRGDPVPMPMSPHLPPPPHSHLLEQSNHIHQSAPGGAGPQPPVPLYGHHPHLGHAAPPTLLHHHHHHPGTLPSVTVPPHLQQHYPPHPHPGIHSQHIPPHPDSIQHQLHHQPLDPYNAGLRLPTASPILGNSTLPTVPHTPQGAPIQHPFGPSSTTTTPDNKPMLPTHLADQGWTVSWSKREARWYFFNTATNESIWDLPVPGGMPGRPQPHGHHYDPITDPLGIQHGGVSVGMKRRASSGECMGSPPKRTITSGPWDLEVSSNVYTAEPQTPRHDILPPHPQIEQLRGQLMVKLRLCYQQACKSREQIDSPKESLNRWLMDQKIRDAKVDPLFPYCENPEGAISVSMFKEIMNDVPMKVVKPRFTGDARKQLAKFTEACKKTIETRSASDEQRKLVKWTAEDTFKWLRETVGAPYESFQERLAHLKQTIQPFVHEAAKSSVEGICKKVSVLSRQYALQSQEAHLALFHKPEEVKKEYPVETGRHKSQAVMCGEYEFTAEAVPLKTEKSLVEYLHQDKDSILIKHKSSEPVRISVLYMQKLDALYKYHNLDDQKNLQFLTRVYCVLKRYNAFCNDYTACQTTQGSIPTAVFESIQRNFGVTFECFSSPLNCYFRNYCSAFPDVDGYFGSVGSFLEFRPISGSFQMHPPLCDDLIDAAITHVEALLASTHDPMSFIIFLPELSGKDGMSHQDSIWINRLQNSGWKRKQVTIPAYEHEYRSGAQHIIPKSEIVMRSHHTTVVFWLQNEAGFEEWKPTEEKVDSLIDSYRPGRERERDRSDLLAPERQNPHQADKALAAAKAIASNPNPTGNTGLPPPPALPTNA